MTYRKLLTIIVVVVLLFLFLVLWGWYTAEPEATPTIDPGTTTASPVPEDTPAPITTPGDTAVSPTFYAGASPTMVLPSMTPTSAEASPTMVVTPGNTPTPPNMATETATPTQIAVIATFPSPYVVQRGDTLWGISEMACGDGRLWPGIWGMNPAIKNPHLIMAGRRVWWGC